MDYIKESIKVETEIFKTMVFVIVVLTAGVYGLWIKLPSHFWKTVPKHYFQENLSDILIFLIGLTFFIILCIFTINRYFAIRKLLKKLKQKENKND